MYVNITDHRCVTSKMTRDMLTQCFNECYKFKKYFQTVNEMNQALGHLCAHIG